MVQDRAKLDGNGTARSTAVPEASTMAVATAAGDGGAGGGGGGSGGGLPGNPNHDVRRRRRSSLDELPPLQRNFSNGSANHLFEPRANTDREGSIGGGGGGGGGSGSPVAAFRRPRRSSTFSEYSQEARDLLNPTPLVASTEAALRHGQPTSRWDTLPLAFALLPAVGGLLVQGGSAFVTDLLLLALGGIFLHWSVTQPWAWYYSAQQVREEHEVDADVAVHSDSDVDADTDADDEEHDSSSPPVPVRAASPTLEDVQEEEEEEGGKAGGKQADDVPANQARRKAAARQNAALRELYRHEAPVVVSARTAAKPAVLHPGAPPSPPYESGGGGGGGGLSAATTATTPTLADTRRTREQLVRDVRAQVQPELDALARALRRTHKQQALLEGLVAAQVRSNSNSGSGSKGSSNGSSNGNDAAWRLQQPVIRPKTHGNDYDHIHDLALSLGAGLAALVATALWAGGRVLALLLLVPRTAAAAALWLPTRVLQAVLGGGGGGGGGGDGKKGAVGAKDSFHGGNGGTATMTTGSTTTNTPVMPVHSNLRGGMGKTVGTGNSGGGGGGGGAKKTLRDYYEYEYAVLGPAARARHHRFGPG
ncbi:hypothetical protein SPI_08272 [Niveomyces insectorum RCEF 264]|uniref:Uncharacterized protein n=1 Tax=Niveomyces insectorum RCEF 264 TaxID=1081102 RepID=A0A167NIG7_9HYPO|nr:hypothetical protein SPI_08272 [Niveomyces insectorum RCEF 264]